MRGKGLSLFGFGALVGLLAVACSSSITSSEFDDGAQSGSSGSSGGSSGSDPFGNGNTDGGNGDGSSDDDGGSCAGTSAEAALTPVNMIVMFDRSGSMGDTKESSSYDPAKRWLPARDAMKAFFTDGASAGMSASLSFFPRTPTACAYTCVGTPPVQNSACTPTVATSCTAADYAAADVALTALPSTTLASELDATCPKGDTPTILALDGAISQAQAVQAGHPNDKTVIVFVTDGEPVGCGQTNTAIQTAAAHAAAVASTIPTYVVGIGPSLDALNAIAAGGGTTKAINVSVNNATDTKNDLIAAMNAIRTKAIQCDFDIPAPPDGRKLDYNKVFVQFTPGGQSTPTTLPYSADCSDAGGWHFDDPKAPKKVLLCTNACDTVKGDAAGKISVAFSCTDRPDIVN